MVGIFLLPIQLNFETKKEGGFALEAKTSSARAVDTTLDKNFPGMIGKDIVEATAVNSAQIKLTFHFISSGFRQPATLTDAGKKFREAFLATKKSAQDPSKTATDLSELSEADSQEFYNKLSEDWDYVYDKGFYDSLDGDGQVPSKGLFIQIYSKDKTELIQEYTLAGFNLNFRVLEDDYYYTITTPSDFEEKNTYNVRIRLDEDNATSGSDRFSNYTSVTTPTKTGNEPTVQSGGTSTQGAVTAVDKLDLKCNNLMDFTVSGCVAQLVYLVWEISALIMKVAAFFLDFLIYYSTNSNSYSNGFITEGWGAVRDVANIFFIISLLFVAIKTILGLNVTNNKQIIGSIVLIALIINFSLFFTRVIIDGSNILAKVFYNNVESKDVNGNIVNGDAGQKSLSMGLVDKFNPQGLLTQDMYNADYGTIRFILLTVILIAIALYTAYMFFTIGLLFVGRVIMLWVSMIFAPIAFISYALPFKIPKLGHEGWWDELFKNAFLAPIFVFFLYIIVMFAGFLSKIAESAGGDSPDFFQKILATLIPFIILFVFIMKAKEIALEYSGELGKSINKLGGSIGGMVVGGAIGGTAILGRASLGRAGRVLGNSERLKNAEAKGGITGFAAGKLLDTGRAASKGSFDLRGIKVAGKNLASTGLQVGSAQKGGYEKIRAEQIGKRQRRAETLKSGDNSKEKQLLNKTEADLHSLNAKVLKDLTNIDTDIENKTKDIADINSRIKAAPPNSTELENARAELADANNFIKDRKSAKKNLREGRGYTTTGKDNNGNTVLESRDPVTIGLDANGNNIGIKHLEDKKKELNFKIEEKNHHRMEDYATSQAGWKSQAFDFVMSGGQHSFRGAREAENKIRSGAKAPAAPEKSHDDHGGGHTSSHSAPAHTAPAHTAPSTTSKPAAGNAHPTH